MTLRTNRRDFLKGSALAGVGFWVAGRMTWAEELKSKSPNERVNVACIGCGVGGKGDSDSDHAARFANVVAICDVDEKRLHAKETDEKKSEELRSTDAKAKKYSDFRKMFDEMGKDIDAVVTSTPDHTHAVATMMAIKAGKHVYTQKPLTHDVWEARQLRLAAKEHKVASQMGNQGTADPVLREGVELIQAGMLGAVKEVHIWTNRPIWPQSPDVKSRPPAEKVPEGLDWNLWLGTAPERPYNEAYHPFKWRGWWDYGTGALGDMGCHTANLPFMALKLGHPSTIQAQSEALNHETYPGWAHVAYDFPARGDMPPVKVNWYEGHKDGKLVHPPKELAEKVLAMSTKARKPNEDHGEKREKNQKDNITGLPRSGSIIVGDKGILYSPHDYGGYWELLPHESYESYKAPSETLPRNPKGDDDENQKKEWLVACKGGPAALSNFDYSGMLTEFILLGNVAIRAGKRLEWDGPNMKFTNAPDAERFLKREYRKPWSL
jgi:predicted dehydrogenase